MRWIFHLDLLPETKRLTLEEMDVVFGSVGVAKAVSFHGSVILYQLLETHIDSGH